MTEEISFGDWLRKQRRALDLSRQAFADQVGCAEVTLRRIEAGTLKPSRELASLILDKLGIPQPERSSWISFARRLSGFPSQSLLPSNKRKSNLPAPLTTFIGREKEQAQVIGLLTQHRLLTLTGPGGVGKTRLSTKVGERFLGEYEDGVWLVELAPILDPVLVPRTTALAVGLREESQRPVIDMLSDYLREKKTLLILDNCEHLLDACAQLVDTLLKRCPGLKILATSREAMGILGEAIYPVPSLELPDYQQILERFRDYESVRLFEERAQLAHMGFSLTIENAATVAKICSQLDGVPLAIELAAARVGHFSLEQIAVRLGASLRLLTTGNRAALPRHQTLQAAIDWSYDLLAPAEQTLFRRLSVFVDGWTLEAAESIGEGGSVDREEVLNLLEQLIKKSMIVRKEAVHASRYHMLETLRQYANAQLVEAGESDALRDRHLEYFLTLAEAAAPHLIRPEQLEWLAPLEADYENLRFAFEWSLSKGTAELSLRLCTALGWYWEIRGHWLEGINWLTTALAIPAQNGNEDEKIARVRAFYTSALLEWQLGNIEKMQVSADASLVLAMETKNKKDIAIANFLRAAVLIQPGDPQEEADSLIEKTFIEFQELNEPFWLAFSYLYLSDYLVNQAKLRFRDKSLRSLELARSAGERFVLADALSKYASWRFRFDQMEEAKKDAEESERLLKEIGSQKTSLNPFLFAEIAWNQGNTQEARLIYLELYERFRLLGEKGFRSNSAGNLGLLAMEEGDLDQAHSYLEESLLIEREAGWQPWVAFYLTALANLFYLQGDLEECKQHFRESLSLRSYFPPYHKTFILMTILGSLYLQNPKRAARILGVIDRNQAEFDFPRTPVESRYCHRAEAHVRKTLGNAAFEAAFGEGQKMSLDEGLDLALKTVEEM